MKLIKKTLCIMSAIACFGTNSALNMSANAETAGTYGDFDYVTVDSDGDGSGDCVKLTHCNESVNEFNIPAEIGGLPVTIIGQRALYNCDNVEKFDIPDNITHIEKEAVTCCDKLSYVTIPETVSYIAEDAFAANFLKSISVAENNKNYCSVDDILFDKNMTTLMVYPVNNGDIEYTVPATVKTIEGSAFSASQTLENITLPAGLTEIKDTTFYYCSRLKSITIPEGVSVIGERAFENCFSLTEVTISDTVTKIGRSAFSGCSALKSITIPESVSMICVCAFEKCMCLNEITIKNPECSIIGDYTIYNSKNSDGAYIFNGTIYGYAGSTAQEYAEKYNRNFVSLDKNPNAFIQGDISGNGKIDLYDAIEICRYIMSMRTFTDEEKVIADYDGNGVVDLYDAIGIAKELLPK